MSDETVSPLDVVRSLGWVVAVHNDYYLDGVFHTFWLFTKGDRFVKGEATSDEEAIRLAFAQIKKMSEPPIRALTVEDVPDLTDRVFEAFLTSFPKDTSNMSPLSHYMDHVRKRWAHNLRAALRGGRGRDFISS